MTTITAVLKPGAGGPSLQHTVGVADNATAADIRVALGRAARERRATVVRAYDKDGREIDVLLGTVAGPERPSALPGVES